MARVKMIYLVWLHAVGLQLLSINLIIPEAWCMSLRYSGGDAKNPANISIEYKKNNCY
jgi:hypothetical protein